MFSSLLDIALIKGYMFDIDIVSISVAMQVKHSRLKLCTETLKEKVFITVVYT